MPRRSKTRVVQLALIGSLLLAWPALGHSTVVEQLAIEELLSQSTYVVRANVIGRHTLEERGPKGEIYTQTELRAAEYFGQEGPRILLVQQLGGTLDGYTLHVEGNASFEIGQEVVAFLDHDHLTGLSYVVGLAQGVFHVQHAAGDSWVSQDLSGLAFYGVGAAPYDLRTTLTRLPDLRERLLWDPVQSLGVEQAGPSEVRP